jgi:3-hydroxyacyl-[acyl-carrier-protein] dehydratase
MKIIENIDINEIMSILPHRYPFLLIDKVIELKISESIIGIKNVTFNEPHFTGHFPFKPVMPGVLIIEAMAQLAAVLVAKSLYSMEEKDRLSKYDGLDIKKEILLMSIEFAKFRKVVEPGDTMFLYATLLHKRAFVWKFSAVAKVQNDIVAESQFTAMVKYKDK